MQRVCTLYRVSTVGQVDHDDIPMQRIACHEFVAKQDDWEIVNELYEKGVSGYKISTDKRDAIAQLKADAVAGKFDILLVFMFDRLGRRDDETPFVVQWFVNHGIRVWSVKEGEQRFENHVDKLLNYIRFWQASGESEKTAIRVKAKHQQMTIAGEYRGGLVPFGFRAVEKGRVNKKNKPVKDLVRDDFEAAIKAEIYRKIVEEGWGSHRIANWLNERGIKTKKGTTLWRDTSVRAMIGNPMDRGQFHMGDVLSEPIEELRIVSDDYFFRAQEIIHSRASQNNDKRDMSMRTSSGGLLTGIIYCGECGQRMCINHCHRVSYTQYGNKDYYWDVYRCYRKVNSRRSCDGQSTYNRERLEKVVDGIVRSFFEKIRQAPMLHQLNSAISQVRETRKLALESAETELAKAKKALSTLEDESLKALAGEGTLTLEMIGTLMAKQRALLNAAQERYNKAVEETKEDGADLEQKKKELEQVLGWSAIYDMASPERKNMILCQLIDRVEVSRGYKVDIFFKISARQFLEPEQASESEISNAS